MVILMIFLLGYILLYFIIRNRHFNITIIVIFTYFFYVHKVYFQFYKIGNNLNNNSHYYGY